MKSISLTLLVVFFAFFSCRATIVYVDSSHIAGTQDGLTWATAFSGFQAGIDAAAAGDSVWVAKGTYKPVSDSSFRMKEGVKIFGGFRKTYTSFSERDWILNKTYLKGDNNSVIRNVANGLTASALLDGFIITNAMFVTGSKGCGVYNYSSSPTFDNCTFSGILSYGLGGGMYNENAAPVITNCTFANNNTNGDVGYVWTSNGGAIFNDHASPEISYCNFSNNSSGYNFSPAMSSMGGAIYNMSSEAVIFKCSFSGNAACNGGAIYNDSSLVTIDSCTFSINVPEYLGHSGTGGDLYNKNCAPVISNSSFEGAASDDVVWSGDGMTNDSASPVISFCSFTKHDGSAIINKNGSAPVISGSIFSDNIGGEGAAIYSYNSAGHIENCVFSDNYTLSSGGAIRNIYSSPEMVNCLFYANSTLGNGGCMDNYYSSPTLINCTFSRNWIITAGGGFTGQGIYNYKSSPVITNCLIWGNGNAIDIPGVDELVDGDSSSSVITYSIVGNLPGDITAHNIDGATNPMFAEPDSGNFRLQAISPLINRGNTAAVPADISLDLAGNDRVLGDTVDIGAYEYVVSAPVFHLGADTAICPGTAFTLDAYTPWSTYLWSTGATDPSIIVSTGGTYYVTVTNEAGMSSDTILINTYPLPVVDLGADTTIESGTAFMLDAGNIGADYFWNTGATTQTIGVDTAGTYWVTVTNESGCFASDTITVDYSLGLFARQMPAGFRLYPNPANGYIMIDCNDPELLNTRLVITDIAGRELRHILLKNRTQAIPLSDLAKGTYLIKAQNGRAVMIIKE